MNLLWRFLVLLIPTLSFASFEDSYAQFFTDHFQAGRFDESLQVLEDWGASQPSNGCRILGMKAAVYLAMGDLEQSKVFMSECIQERGDDEISDPSLDYVISMYYKALENNPEDLFAPVALTQLCKLEQPKGIKLKYWFGVGQILARIYKEKTTRSMAVYVS